MRRRLGLVYVASAALVVFIIMLLRQQETTKAVLRNGSSVATNAPTHTLTTPTAESGGANRASVPPALISEFNRFILETKPFGLDNPIKAEDITGVTNYPKQQVIFQTKTHMAEFWGQRLHYFLAHYDASNPLLADPAEEREAVRRWYQATGKWSPEEALAETYRVMERLGIRFEV